MRGGGCINGGRVLSFQGWFCSDDRDDRFLTITFFIFGTDIAIANCANTLRPSAEYRDKGRLWKQDASRGAFVAHEATTGSTVVASSEEVEWDLTENAKC